VEEEIDGSFSFGGEMGGSLFTYFPTPIEDTKVDPPNLIRNVYSFDAQHNAIHFGHYKDEESNDS
jgi:hypothetical protein